MFFLCLVLTLSLPAGFSLADECIAHGRQENPMDRVPAASDRLDSPSLSHVAMETDDMDDLDILEQEFEDKDRVGINDPLYYWNKAMFQVNDKFYFCLLKPTAQAYRFLVPETIRHGVKNFFYNLGAPIRVVNCILQGKVDRTADEIARFMLNTTVGVLGFGNPAKVYPQLNPPAEDLGQTLGGYGMGNGFYLVWPILGSSTLRDTLGFAGDSFLNPLRYVNPSEAAMALYGLKTVNTTSFHIGDYEDFKAASVTPYEALRDAYIQRRAKQIQE